MTRPTPVRAHPPGGGEGRRRRERETGRSMRSKYGFRGGGVLAVEVEVEELLGEGGGEDEAGKRTGSGIGRREWRRKRDPTVEIWSWRAGSVGSWDWRESRREIRALMMKEREMMEVEMERIHEQQQRSS
ncbi:hypothetical protein Scep_001712 [Stephania cephalantha]|uniref:Uncharacterized protein n=1 Tax=Stephania cephalantha TaxID=152367 RepID=A0AAP0L8R2_9MAGN